MYKALGNESEDILERFIKSISLTVFLHMEYYIYGTGTLIALLGPHDKFFISDFGIWTSVKKNPDEICIPIRMQKVWRYLGIIHQRVEQL